MGRGTFPSDVLFIGEAPGELEDLTGRPFIGPAGKCLDDLLVHVQCRILSCLESAGYDTVEPWTYSITNIVACLPFSPGEKIIPPNQEAVRKCKPRLEEVIDLANPLCIVSLGETAKAGLANVEVLCPTYHVYHPSYILRKGGQSSFEFKRWVIDVSNILLWEIYSHQHKESL